MDFSEPLAARLAMDQGRTSSILVQVQEFELEEAVGDMCTE